MRLEKPRQTTTTDPPKLTQSEDGSHNLLLSNISTPELRSPELVSALHTWVQNLELQLATCNTIIGDDVAGRLPTLFLREIIQQTHPNRNPGTFFVAGGLRSDEYRSGALREHFYTLQKDGRLRSPVLFVTEFIGSGSSLTGFIEIFQELDIEFHVTTLSLSPEFEENENLVTYRPDLLPSLTKNLTYGERGTLGLDTFGGLLAHGVRKQGREHPSAITVPEKHVEQEVVNKARDDVRNLATLVVNEK